AVREARINERLSRYSTAEEKILSIFDLLGEAASQSGYKGCAFARAGADANSSAAVKGVCAESRAFVLNKFTELARQAAAPDPELLGRQLVCLYDGAATAAYMDRDQSAASTARAVAVQALANALVDKARQSNRRSR